jgi:V/A-type H+-transporting ATPase subunit B
MPAGDITHPVPDVTGYITEGQVVLSQELHTRGIYPPFDALASLSRLMRRGAGPGRTRDDHLEIAAQLYGLAAQSRQVADLADVVGAAALSARERRYLEFADRFATRFLAQEPAEGRSLDDTLDRAWAVASLFPREELATVSRAVLDAHYLPDGDNADTHR